MSTTNLDITTASPPSARLTRDLGTGDLVQDLGRRSARSGAIAVAGQGARLALQLGSTAVLARVLAPADFGLVAMVTVITGFVMVVRNAGLSTAVIQREAIEPAQVNALFWINAALGIALAAVVAAGAPLIAWFYGEPRVAALAAALGLSFIPAGLAVQHQALLRRRMRFGAVVAVDLAAFGGGAATAVVLALAGAGPWALVALTLTATTIATIGAWIACPWRPGRPRGAQGLRRLLSFGGDVTGASVLAYAVRRMDDLLIGWSWGPALLGLYAKAYALLMLPLGQFGSPIGAVAVPALSRLQHDRARHRQAFLRMLRMLGWTMLPMAAVLTAFAGDIVDIVLGTQWTSAKPIFIALALSAFVQPLATATGWLQVSLDQTRRMFAWSVFAGAVRLVAFVVALPWGPIGIAIAFTISTLLLRPPHLWHAMRPAQMPIHAVMGAFGAPLLTCGAIAIAMSAVRWLGPLDGVPAMAAALAAGAATLAIIALLFARVRADLVDAMRAGRDALHAPPDSKVAGR